MKRNLLIALGIGLVAGSLGYFLIKRKREECVEVVEEKEKEVESKNNQDIIESAVKEVVEESEFENPGDLLEKIVYRVVRNCSDFSILSDVPKNIEEVEEYMKEKGLYEKYESVLQEKYKRKE